MSLKECFRTYINPNTIDYTDKRIWQHLYDNDVLSIFQFDAASGRRGVLATKPESLAEMTAVNGLIRLITPEDGEDQLDRFCANKEFPERFEKEMVEANLPLEVRQIMHEVLDPYQGCAATQETFMILTRRLLGYSLRDADVLRKVVAKKKTSEIQTQRDFFEAKGMEKKYNKNQLDYLWNVIIAPSLGYGFSLNHALPYSMVGIQCILMGGILFHPIYWQAACLLQRSGALDGKTTDYNKIAKAVSALSEQGVNIQPPSVNKSKIGFELDEETNTIYFGLSGIKGLKEKVIDSIIDLRPFKSIYDFMVRTNADVTSLTTLVKAGAFDEFGSRLQVIYDISRFKSDQKMKLNGQNFSMLAKNGFWPMHTPELKEAFYFFNFNQYLKLTNKNHSDSEMYSLNERAKNFLIEKGIDFEENDTISKVTWKKYYDSYMVPMKQYLVEHQQEMLQKVNEKMIADWRDKYFPPDSNLSQWEIETLGLCFGEHPMSHLINVSYFNDLPIEPEVSRTFLGKGGRTVPLYKLTMIAGIVIAKDKLHSSITLLTSDGPVEVKFRKQQFANYDAQISKMVDGHKKVIEKSWLNRGVGLIIHGMRQDDQFIAKTYKNSPMKHTAYKVIEILSNGKVKVQIQRKSGEQEESEDE